MDTDSPGQDATPCTVESALKDMIRQSMVEGGYVTNKVASEIAADAAKGIYQAVATDMQQMQEELDRQRDRQEQIWESIFKPKEVIMPETPGKMARAWAWVRRSEP